MIDIMQKRINEIKQQDRKSYYEIANEIGISESTLYKLMSKGELFTPAEQKITAYLKDYLTKDEKLEAYRLNNAELKAENDRLKARKDKYYQQTLDDEIQINELLHTLQEIKAIAESPRECILSEVSCCNICERLDKISHIITKAEEEWK